MPSPCTLGGLSGWAPEVAELVDLLRGIRVAAREHPVRERAQRVEVGALVERRPLDGFGRDRRGRTHHVQRRAERGERAEVEQLAVPVGRHADVRGAEIPVNEAPRVEQREGGRDVTQVQAPGTEGQRRRSPHVVPFEELHRVIRADLVDAVVVDTNDPRVVEAGEDLVFALERRDVERIAGDLGLDALQGASLAAGAVVHAVDDAHAARRELLLHDVARAHDPVWLRKSTSTQR